jgi:hypothetical protein
VSPPTPPTYLARPLFRAACLLVICQMRQIEEAVPDQGARWELLRQALEQFVKQGEQL